MLACLTSTAGGILLAKTIDTHVVPSEIQTSNLYISLFTGCSGKKKKNIRKKQISYTMLFYGCLKLNHVPQAKRMNAQCCCFQAPCFPMNPWPLHPPFFFTNAHCNFRLPGCWLPPDQKLNKASFIPGCIQQGSTASLSILHEVFTHMQLGLCLKDRKCHGFFQILLTNAMEIRSNSGKLKLVNRIEHTQQARGSTTLSHEVTKQSDRYWPLKKTSQCLETDEKLICQNKPENSFALSQGLSI